MKPKPELLAPAGSPESAKAAIHAGADAIYLGGKNFSARNFADNFTDQQIVETIEYAALRGVKVYVAVNTLYKDEELPKVLKFVNLMHNEGASAFIVQDIGLAHLIKNHLPDVDIHASTQMSIHNAEGVKFMQKMGFKRVVLARELSIEEIAKSVDTGLECEVFVHGALCVSYSGQCLMSSLIGGRSGNRGKCAQVCRQKYDLLKDGQTIKSGYLLSPKDMMTLDMIQDIVNTGVASLKIEGRMKSAEYVYIVTKAYRDALDGTLTQATKQAVTQIFNRGGDFCQGYYNTFAGTSMMSIKTPKSTGILVGEVVNCKNGKSTIKFNQGMIPGDGIQILEYQTGAGVTTHIGKNKTAQFNLQAKAGNLVYKSYDKRLMDDTKKAMLTDSKKLEVTGEIIAKVGKNIKLTLNGIEEIGEVIEGAKNAPLSKEDIIAQLSKTGNTPFVIKFEKINIDENIFISKQKLNELRRSALDSLQEEIIQKIKRNSTHNYEELGLQNKKKAKPKQSIQAKNVNAIINKTSLEGVSRVYLQDLTNADKITQSEIFAVLPHISRDASKETIMEFENTNVDGYLVGNYGQLNILQTINTKKKIILDYSFNIFNSEAARVFQKEGYGITVSQELNLNETNRLVLLNDLDCESIVYGRQIVISTHNCPVGLYDSNKSKNGKYCNKRHTAKDGEYTLLDRKGVSFPILTDCQNCIAHVLNSKVLNAKVENIGVGHVRSIINDEHYIEEDGYTNGHFFRGVE